LTGAKADLLTKMASLYRGVAERLGSFRNKVKASDGEDLRYNAIGLCWITSRSL